MCSIDGPESGRPLADLEREICELAGHIAAATCRWLLLLAEFDERLGWAEWGVRSCAHWLSWRCSIGLCAAREHVRVARRLVELPLVREAFASGELSYSKVRAVVRVALPETEAQLVELARHATGAQLERLVRGYRQARAVSLGAAAMALERRSVSWSWDDQGCLRLSARLPADEGALVLAALDSAAAAGPSRPAREPEEFGVRFGVEDVEQGPVSAEHRNADALVTIARAALDAPEGGRTGGDPCEVVVHVDAATLVADDAGAGDADRAELAAGPSLSPETVRRLGCDAALVRIIERDGVPLSVGRRTRAISPALRRALRSRDGGCAFPGCDHTRFLHAHHIRHWAHGGRTDLANLVQLCSYHHRLVHEGGFAVERAGPRAVRFRRPDGRLVPAVCAGARARGPGLESQNAARGLRIQPDTCRPRSAGDRLDYGIAVEGLLWRESGPP